jgi:hypothetical protein
MDIFGVDHALTHAALISFILPRADLFDRRGFTTKQLTPLRRKLIDLATENVSFTPQLDHARQSSGSKRMTCVEQTGFPLFPHLRILGTMDCSLIVVTTLIAADE